MTHRLFPSRRILILAAITTLPSVSCFAKFTVWTNASGDSQFNNPANWDDGVPSGTDDVLLQADGSIIVPADGASIRNLTAFADNTVFSGGTLTLTEVFAGNSAAVFNNPVNISAGVFPFESEGVTFNSPVGDKPGSSIPATFAETKLSGLNTFRGPAVLFGSTISTGGSVASAQGIGIVDTLQLSVATAGFNQLPDAGSLSLVGAKLTVVNTAGAATTETIGALNLQASQSNIQYFGTPNYHLAAQSFSRGSGAMLTLSGDGLQITSAATPTEGTTGTGTSRQAIPWIALLISNSPTFYTYDLGASASDPSDDVGLRPLSDSEYASSFPSSTANAVNVRLRNQTTLSSDSHVLSLVANQYAINLAGHRLSLDGGLILSSSNGAADVVGGGTMQFSRDANIFATDDSYIDSTIQAPTLNFGGSGTLSLLRANSLPGGIFVNSGTLTSRTKGALGSGTVVVAGGNLRVEGSDQTIADLSMPTFSLAGIGEFGINQMVYTGTGITLTLQKVESDVYMGGSGTVYLPAGVSARNVDVIGSTLRLDGQAQSVGLSGSDSHLVGTGIVSGGVTADARGSVYIAPGPGVGRLIFGSLNCGSVGRSVPVSLQFDLDGTSAGTSYDQIVLNSNFPRLDITNALFDLNVGYTPQAGQVLEIIDYRGTGPLQAAMEYPEGSIINADGYQFQISYLGGTGNDVTLTVVPEPSCVMLGIGAIGLIASRRRRSITDSK